MDCTDNSQGFPVDDTLKAAVSSYLSETSAEPNIGSKPRRKQHATTGANLYDDFATYTFEQVSKEVKSNANNVLPYVVSDYSSYSGMYYPHNIMENKPSDQSSRWSSASNDQSQYLMLKFEHPVVACSITFGKFHRGHVCNVKEFKIYGGMKPDSDMVELLHSGLRNDTVPEMFPLLHITQKSMVFPIQYLKIVPLSTYGVSFNYCIWFVQVRGNNDVGTISKVLKLYREYKETETARYCLKYFRQRNMMDMYYMLKNRLGISLEDSLVSELHEKLVMEGNYEAAEEIVDKAHVLNIFEPFAQRTKYTLEWKQIQTENENYRPCARGGHQMCLDIQRHRIYLFGGWNGVQDLADFWYYSIQNNTWHLISPNTEMDRGPKARSCHKICLDAQGNSLLVFGRYIDQFSPKIKSALPDLYRYWIDEDRWEKVSENTLNDGGPDILYDSQLCVDSITSELYMFGGQDVRARPMDGRQIYGDLYSLHVDDNVWECIRRDGTERSNDVGVKGLKSRVGHSMLFDTTTRDLYILGGKRHKDQLMDLIRFSVDQDQLVLLSDNISKDDGPSGTFTQRAAIDCQKQEIYVHTATMKKNVANAPVTNDFYVYSIRTNQWIRVEGDSGPLPRYAHELVYNPEDGVFYLFGGNPGNSKADAKRLDDFWQFRLRKPDSASILRRCKYMLRMQKLRELCRRQTSPFTATNETMQALEYLRTKVAPLVDEENMSEQQEFQMICSRMFISSEITQEGNPFDALPEEQGTSEVFAERTRLFEDIIAYLPPEMREPSGQLTDVVRI